MVNLHAESGTNLNVKLSEFTIFASVRMGCGGMADATAGVEEMT